MMRADKLQEFQQAFAAFLAAYGHRGHYETYCRSLRLRDQPEALLAQLDTLAEVDEGALRQRQRQAAEQAWQKVAAALPFWRRPTCGSRCGRCATSWGRGCAASRCWCLSPGTRAR